MRRSLPIGGDRLPVSVDPRPGHVTVRLDVPTPGVDVATKVRIDFQTRHRPWHASVFTEEAPVCLKHRFDDGSLCMWWGRHPRSRRWVGEDGLPALIHYIQVHLFQEACCRAGLPWPGEEAPGQHPRKRRCPTCQGMGL
jgi:hypothetical protein